MNMGICEKCGKVVPVSHHQESGKEYLHKNCPDCGLVVTLLSQDAARYRQKRSFMDDRSYQGCHMLCLDCVHKTPNIVFVETTNRCNMNCPICITNVPSMGFQFEPRMEFFDKIFKHCSQLPHPPSIQLFGGEPTMREDMFDIIKLAKSYGLIVRIATNGLKMADKAYAQKVIESGATVLIAFDGFKKEMYTKLRAHAGAFEQKLKAIENLSQHQNGKVVLMTVIDKQINGDEIPELLKFCVNKPHIRGIYFMPLTHVWSKDTLDYGPERTTQEDIEHFIEKAVGGGEFIPMGSLELNNIQKALGRDVITFAGVHANCESFNYLIPQGDKFVSISRFLKHGLAASVKDLRALDKRVAERISGKPAGFWTKVWVNFGLVKVYLKHWDFCAMVGKRGFPAVLRWMRIFVRLALKNDFMRVVNEETVFKHPNVVLETIILPFEDNYTLESERLHLCASCFCYVDTEDDTVKSIPFCIWEKYKKEVMKDIAEKYNKEGYRQGLSGGKQQGKKDEKGREYVTFS